MGMRHVIAGLFMAAALAACASQGPKVALAPAPNLAPAEGFTQGAKPGVPKWVTGITTYPDKICAVGACDPAFLASAGKPCAADDARAALAKSISVNVATVTVEETRNGVESRDKATVVSGMKGWESDVEMDESVIQEYWYDGEGVASHMKGVTYALACIPKEKLAGHGKSK